MIAFMFLAAFALLLIGAGLLGHWLGCVTYRETFADYCARERHRLTSSSDDNARRID